MSDKLIITQTLADYAAQRGYRDPRIGNVYTGAQWRSCSLTGCPATTTNALRLAQLGHERVEVTFACGTIADFSVSELVARTGIAAHGETRELRAGIIATIYSNAPTREEAQRVESLVHVIRQFDFPAPETLALDYAGRCDGCGNDAVELCTWLEDDGASGQRLSYCRPCMGDEADDPSNEWTTGEAI